MSDAQTLTRQLRGRWLGSYGVARCPAHDDRSPSLSLADSTDGRLLLKCHAGCSFEAIRDALGGGDLGGASKVSDEERDARRVEHAARSAKRSAQARRLWEASEPIRLSLARRYLEGRSIGNTVLDAIGSDVLRFNPACWHLSGMEVPAFIARVSGGDGFAVHRTYIQSARLHRPQPKQNGCANAAQPEPICKRDPSAKPLCKRIRIGGDGDAPCLRICKCTPPDAPQSRVGKAIDSTYLVPRPVIGKANVTPNKTMLGQTKGGAVRLIHGRDYLVVAEGIETALSLGCGMLPGKPAIWAALSASGMAGLHLPIRRERLVIASDGDPVGRKAAQTLATRADALGWRVELLPAPDGQDWNDVLRAQAVAA